MMSTQSLNHVMPTGLKDADWKTLCKVRFERGNPYRNFPGVAEYIRSQPMVTACESYLTYWRMKNTRIFCLWDSTMHKDTEALFPQISLLKQ